MIPQDSTHTLNLLKTIYQRAISDLLSKKKKLGVILPKIKQEQVFSKHHSQLTLNQKQQNLQLKRKLGQFQSVQNKIQPQKLSQIIKLDTTQINSSQVVANESLKIYRYISSLNEIKQISRIKNRKYKFNSLQF